MQCYSILNSNNLLQQNIAPSKCSLGQAIWAQSPETRVAYLGEPEQVTSSLWACSSVPWEACSVLWENARKALCWTTDILSDCQLLLFQDRIARFVSLIPFTTETLDENDGFDIWMTSEVTNDTL